jgi:hypothetical protein
LSAGSVRIQSPSETARGLRSWVAGGAMAVWPPGRKMGVLGEQSFMEKLHKAIALLLKIPMTVYVEILVNFILPYFVYVKTSPFVGQVHALIASSLPPIVWAVARSVYSRRTDAVSLMVIFGIFLSLVAFIGGGSVRFVQLRQNLVIGLIGLVFLSSILLRRPLILPLARATILRSDFSNVRVLDELQENQEFRRDMTMLTAVWGIALLAETAAACILLYCMPIQEFLIVNPVVGYGAMGGLVLWSFWSVKRWR